MRKNYFLASILAGMLLSAPVSADEISMHTSAAIGEKLSIALNENVKATLTWGDGVSEEISFQGDEVQITVKHQDFTLKSDQSITSLYCADCSLTELNVKNAPALQALICSGNQLTDLDLSANSGLKNLDCSGNLLTALTFNKCPELVFINVADNQMDKLYTSSLPDLKTLICSNNKFTSLSLSSQKKLETLWCQGNEITSINIAPTARPVQVCAFDNQLATLKTDALDEVKELWLDNNKLKTLNLSETHVEVVSVSNNLLTSITWNEDDKESLKAFYADGNELMINSLPTLFKKDTLITYNIDNQRPYHLVDQINVGERLDVNDLVRKNAWGYTARPDIVWKDEQGTELKRNEDFKYLNGVFTFHKPFKSIHAEVTSPLYPGAMMGFADLQVLDPTGIEDVAVNQNLQIVAEAGQIQLTTPVGIMVRIYNVSGNLVVNSSVEAGTSSWNLPAGLYVVNGKKVLLAR